MKRLNRYAKIGAASIVFALVMYGLAAIPGLVSNQSSTTTAPTQLQVRR